MTLSDSIVTLRLTDRCELPRRRGGYAEIFSDLFGS
jgi:hypothetical protein